MLYPLFIRHVQSVCDHVSLPCEHSIRDGQLDSAIAID
jgi:hypothetical protein